jgi:hypothetical protein
MSKSTREPENAGIRYIVLTARRFHEVAPNGEE